MFKQLTMTSTLAARWATIFKPKPTSTTSIPCPSPIPVAGGGDTKTVSVTNGGDTQNDVKFGLVRLASEPMNQFDGRVSFYGAALAKLGGDVARATSLSMVWRNVKYLHCRYSDAVERQILEIDPNAKHIPSKPIPAPIPHTKDKTQDKSIPAQHRNQNQIKDESIPSNRRQQQQSRNRGQRDSRPYRRDRSRSPQKTRRRSRSRSRSRHRSRSRSRSNHRRENYRSRSPYDCRGSNYRSPSNYFQPNRYRPSQSNQFQSNDRNSERHFEPQSVNLFVDQISQRVGSTTKHDSVG